MAKSESSKGKKAIYVKYNEELALDVAMKHQKFLEAVGRL